MKNRQYRHCEEAIPTKQSKFRGWIASLMLAMTLIVFPAAVQAGEGIRAHDAYAYATSEAQKNGAVFMMIENPTGKNDRVIAAQASETAARAELHTHIMDGDMMMMREVEAYDLPAAGTVRLEPMGHHIMLMGLKQKLVSGASFPMFLSFEEHDPVIVEVQVVPPGAVME